MLQVDEFESVFRAADKPPFKLQRPELGNVLVVTDGIGEDERGFCKRAQSLLEAVAPEAELGSLGGHDFDSVEALLDGVRGRAPDLICTHRNLKDEGWKWGHSLGTYFNVLTRETDIPVLVLPHPRSEAGSHAVPDLREVMVVADHLTGDQSLVNWGLRMTRRGGTLFLTHVEDDLVFQRYLATIGKIPEIDTDTARREILEQLLKEPRDYIASCRRVVEEAGEEIEIREIIRLGHRVTDHQRLVAEHAVDLLVFHTREEGQIAMHGVAYSLAVALRDLPLLMI